jgi:hypothetical protein
MTMATKATEGDQYKSILSEREIHIVAYPIANKVDIFS